MAEKSGSNSAKRRNDLSLKMKYEVIKSYEREPTIGSRKLAETFKCGRTQIQTIVKNKETIKAMYESNASDKLSHIAKGQETLSMLTSMRLYISGTSLQLQGTFFQMERS